MLDRSGTSTRTTNLKVAESVARALKPGGRFLLDIVNRDYVVSDLPTRVWWEGDGCVVLEEVDFNFHTSRIVTRRSVVFEDGRQLEQEISVRAYSPSRAGPIAAPGRVPRARGLGQHGDPRALPGRQLPQSCWSWPRSGPTSARLARKPRAITALALGVTRATWPGLVRRPIAPKARKTPLCLAAVETHVFSRGVRPICGQSIARSDRIGCSIWNIYLSRNVYQKRVQQYLSGPEKRNDESKYGERLGRRASSDLMGLEKAGRRVHGNRVPRDRQGAGCRGGGSRQ